MYVLPETSPMHCIRLVAISTLSKLLPVTDTAFAALIKPLLDGSFVEKDPEIIQMFPLLLIGLFLLRSIAGFVSTYGIAWVGRNVIKQIRKEYVQKRKEIEKYLQFIKQLNNFYASFNLV